MSTLQELNSNARSLERAEADANNDALKALNEKYEVEFLQDVVTTEDRQCSEMKKSIEMIAQQIKKLSKTISQDLSVKDGQTAYEKALANLNNENGRVAELEQTVKNVSCIAS